MTEPARRLPQTPADQAAAIFRESLRVRRRANVPHPTKTQPIDDPAHHATVQKRPLYPQHVVIPIAKQLYARHSENHLSWEFLARWEQELWINEALDILELIWRVNTIWHPSGLRNLPDDAQIHTAHDTAGTLGFLRHILRPDHFPIHVLWWGAHPEPSADDDTDDTDDDDTAPFPDMF